MKALRRRRENTRGSGEGSPALRAGGRCYEERSRYERTCARHGFPRDEAGASAASGTLAKLVKLEDGKRSVPVSRRSGQ
jgi:hypothetical protein